MVFANKKVSSVMVDGQGVAWSTIGGRAHRLTHRGASLVAQFAFPGTLVATVEDGPVFYDNKLLLVVGDDRVPVPFPASGVGSYSPGGGWALLGDFFWSHQGERGFVRAEVGVPQGALEFSFTSRGWRMLGLASFPEPGNLIRRQVLTWLMGENGWMPLPTPPILPQMREIHDGGGHLLISGPTGAMELTD
jgi:hypothetical protein